MAAYYPQLSVHFIDPYGYHRPVRNDSINVYNVTTASAAPDFSTDNDGIIAEGMMSGAKGDVIELSHDTYPLTMRLTLQADQESAYTLNANELTIYIVEDQSSGTTLATAADIYIKDPDGYPQLLGSVKAGETGKFPVQTSLPKTMTVYAVSKSDSFLKTENAFENGTDVIISATVGQFVSIFDFYTDLTTAGTIAEDLSTDTIPANTFLLDGDEVRVTYRGYYDSNANDKQIKIVFDGAEIFDLGVVNKNSGGWVVEVHLTRSDTDAVRCTVSYHDAISQDDQYNELTGRDFTSDLDIALNATTATAAGDLTLASAKAFFIPAAADALNYVTVSGVTVTVSGIGVTVT